MYARGDAPDKGRGRPVDKSGRRRGRPEQDRPVRWAALFADLAAQHDALEQAELAAEVAERIRGEVSGLGVLDRLRAAVGAELHVALRGGTRLVGTLNRVGIDWLLLTAPDRVEVLVATPQLLSVRGLHRAAAVPGTMGLVESRIGIRQPLRALARDRAVVRCHLIDGSAHDGVIDRVAADFVDLTPARGTHQRGERSRDELVMIAAIAAVRRSV
jgi:hypothetical protein